MDSPFDNTFPAFEPFFDEVVVITHADKPQSIPVCIFADGIGDALAEDSVDTDREDITLIFRREDWAYVQTLQRGDILKRTVTNGKSYTVQSSKYDSAMGWCVSARSI